MAGTREVTNTATVKGLTVTGVYQYEWPDGPFDAYDAAGNWELRPWDVGYLDWSGLDLIGDITVDVTGSGSMRLRYFRWQGGSPKPWREGVYTEATTPVSFPAGSGPNPRLVSDLAGAESQAVD